MRVCRVNDVATVRAMRKVASQPATATTGPPHKRVTRPTVVTTATATIAPQEAVNALVQSNRSVPKPAAATSGTATKLVRMDAPETTAIVVWVATTTDTERSCVRAIRCMYV